MFELNASKSQVVQTGTRKGAKVQSPIANRKCLGLPIPEQDVIGPKEAT